MKNTISIIVPVYNIEKYLPECLDSILRQSFRDFEVIVVDDGSTDRCPAICDRYARLDARIKVFHRPNGGVSRARNFGMAQASGEWLMFLDSDDYIAPETVERLVACAEKTGADIVSCAFYHAYANRNILAGHDDGKIVIQEYAPDEFVREITVLPHRAEEKCPACFYPWGKIIKRSLLADQDISFPQDMHPHEDVLFNAQVFMLSSKHAYLRLPLFYYRQRKNASTKSATKDYFANNKKFCECARLLKRTDGSPVLSDADFAVTCTRFFSYAILNLWTLSSGSPKRARAQLTRYLNDSLFSQQLDKARDIDISGYGLSYGLLTVFEAARNKDINKLLVYAKTLEIKEKLKDKTPIIGKRLFV